MRYEIKKLLRRKEVWIVLGLTLLAIVLLSFRDIWRSMRQSKILQQKMAVYRDMPLDEAEVLLTEEWEALGGFDISMDDPEYEEWLVVRSLKESAAEYQAHEANLKQLIAKMYNDLEHAATDFERRDIAHALRLYNRKIDYQLCHYRGLIFAMLSIEEDVPMQNLYLLILCTVFAPLFAVEHETGMHQVLFASKKGKKGLYYKKIGGGMLCAAIFAFSYTAILFLMVWCKYGLSFRMLLAPVQCVEQYQNCPYAISILTFAVLTACMRALIGAWIAALTALVSCCFRRTLAVFGTTAAAAAVPVLLSQLFVNVPTGKIILKRLGLIQLSHLGDYLAQYDTVNVFGFPVSQIWLSVGCTCGIILCLLTVAYAIYTKQTTHIGKQVKPC